MPQAYTTSRAPLTAEERVELRIILFSRRYRRWLWKQSTIWVKWVGVVGAAALAAVHWAADFAPAVLKLLSIIGLHS